jgi:hypothetical protein
MSAVGYGLTMLPGAEPAYDLYQKERELVQVAVTSLDRTATVRTETPNTSAPLATKLLLRLIPGTLFIWKWLPNCWNC